jgi:hypothetical protein
MRYIKDFRMFEAVIMPTVLNNNSVVNSFQTLIEYGQQNEFDVVNYDEFYNSLPEDDKKTAPPRHGIPFFALFHPVNKRPMFVLVDPNAARFIPNFKEIVDDIIGHEKIHGEQTRRKGDVEYSLPSPTDKKAYFSNKEEIMAFSWTIANGLSKRHRDIKSAMNSLDEEFVIHRGMGMRPEEHKMIWNDIKRYCDEKTIKRYRKYIYLYLENIFNEKSPVN